MANIELSAKGGNFLWRNILSHDPCHDWTPNGSAKRLAKINSSFAKFENIPEEDSTQVGGNKKKRGKRSYVQFGGNKKNIMKGGDPTNLPSNIETDYSDLVENSDMIGLYDEFDNDESTFNVIYDWYGKASNLEVDNTVSSNAQYILNSYNSLLGMNNLEIEDMNSSVYMNTRGKERNRRICISQVQKVCEYNDYNRIDFISYIPTPNTLMDPQFDDSLSTNSTMYGGRVLANKVSTQSPLSVFDQTTSKPELDAHLNNKTNILVNNELPKQSSTGNKIDEIKSIFTYLKNRFNNYTDFDEDITEDIKQKIVDYYNCFEHSLLFYVKNINSELPLFSVVNTYFIKDSLFIFLINQLLYDKDGIRVNKIEPSDELFNEIVKIRNNDEKYITLKQNDNSNVQSGGAKIGTADLLRQINELGNVDNFMNTINEILSPNLIAKAIRDDIRNIMTRVNNELFDQDDQVNTSIQTNIDVKLFSFDNGFLAKKWIKENCFYNIINLQKKIQETTGNTRAQNRHIKTLDSLIRDLYISVHSALQKQYKLSSKQVTFRSDSDSNSASPSPTAIKTTNNFLATITRGILMSSGPEYNQMKQVERLKDGYEYLYETEAEMLKNVVKNGRVENSLDSKLLESFVKCVKQKHPNNYIPCKIENVIQGLFETFTKPGRPIKIINNAMTTKNGHGSGSDKLVNIMIEQEGFEIKCPKTSILDSQGTFGSCSGGSGAIGYISNNQEITITDEKDLFEFNIGIKQTGKKTVMEYYSIYDAFTISDCVVEAVIQNNLLNILSANNTFKDILNELEKCWWENGGVINWRLFEYNPNNNKLIKLIRIASRKMMGDFGQELTAVADKGGFTSILDWNNILLTNGDQPSTVRAGYMLLNNLGGVNSNTNPRTNTRETRDVANVLFVTSKQGHIFTGRPSSSRMGGGKNKKKKTLKKKKPRKKSNLNKKSKTKKIDYYINKIYGKNK